MDEQIRWEDPTPPEEMARQIYAIIKKVEEAEAPADAGIGHFGIGMTLGTENIGISNHGGRLLITIYRAHGAGLIGAQTKSITCPTCGHTKHPPIYTHPGYSKGVHDERMRALAAAFDIKVWEHWNGQDKHDGISIVLDRPPPASLLAALKRGPTCPVHYSDWVERITEGRAT